jgi:tetratricopeptide (TPR) repeat protein
MSNLETQVYKIGDLLVELSLVSQKDLNEALQIGKDTGLPIGRVLTMSAFLTESQFQAALKGQSLLKDGLVQLATVKEAVRRVTNGASVEEAYSSVGVAKVEAQNSVQLDELLSRSGLVTADQLDSAVEQTKTTGLPLGRILLMSGNLAEGFLIAALNAQILVRDGQITKDQAVEGLKGVKRRQVPLEVALAEKGAHTGASRPTIRLGELLAQANIISNVEVMNAIEIGLNNNKQIGQILLELDRIDSNTLNYALHLQERVELGQLTPDAAIESLMTAKQQGMPRAVSAAPSNAGPNGPTPSVPVPSNEPAEKPSTPPPSIVKFLRQNNRLTDEGITTALQMALRDNELIGRLLVQAQVLDGLSVQVAIQLCVMLEQQRLTMDWANAAFQHCVNERVPLDEALQVLSLKHKAITQNSLPAVPVPTPAQNAAPPAQNPVPPVQNPVPPVQTNPPIQPPPVQPSEPAGTPRAPQAHPASATWENLRRLGEEAFNTNHWAEAEKHWSEAVKASEPFGENDQRYAYSLEKLGEVLLNQKRYDQAEPIMLRAHTLKLRMLGADHLSVAATINSLSKLYYFQGKYEQAEPLARQFVQICENNLGAEHPDVARGIHNLATLYHVSAHYEQAEEQYKRALAICKKTLGNDHTATTRLVKSYASLLKGLNRKKEAEDLDAFVQGTITGSWKVVSINSDEALHDGQQPI